MRLNVWSTLLAAFFVAAVPAFSQVRSPAATGGGIPLIVGAGFSNYNDDFGADRREDGATIWADWTIRQLPRMLQGVGVEIIARDLSFGASPVLQNMRYDTAGGGVIYHYLRPRNVLPYAKVGEQFGSIDYPLNYRHDTRNFLYFGGGADFHAGHHLWVRADYEYQMWNGLFGRGHALTPNGFTFGPEFDFGTRGAR